MTAALEQHERRVRFGRVELRREVVRDFVGRTRPIDARDDPRVTASSEREVPPLRNQQHAVLHHLGMQMPFQLRHAD